MAAYMPRIAKINITFRNSCIRATIKNKNVIVGWLPSGWLPYGWLPSGRLPVGLAAFWMLWDALLVLGYAGYNVCRCSCN